ncbi:MAG: ATP-dependent DNA ligase [Chloroflexi bacterium]|nr:ATP-dependent DNA ligase [Chloroflexota bacterium]
MKFARLVSFFGELESTSSRNKMVGILAELFKEAGAEDIDRIVYLCQGRLVPFYEPLEFGIGENLIAESLAKAIGTDRKEVKALFSRLGDYGLVAADKLPQQGHGLEVLHVYEQLWRIATAGGSGSVAQKTDLLADLLSRLSAEEGKHLLRIVLGKLRLGIGDPTIMDGLSYARAGDKSLRKTIERAYNLCSDLGQVAGAFWKRGVDGLSEISVQVGKPVRPALAERATSAMNIISRLQKAATEPKYDGFRCQVHKNGDVVKVFSRNLEDFSGMFPEIVRATREQVKHPQAVFEGEAIAYNPQTGDFFPFQVTVQRKRKHGIDAMQEKLPLKMMAFDLLYLDGYDYTTEPYTERRTKLLEVIGPDDVISVADVLVTADAEELDAFFADNIQRGLEGIVAKRLDAPYQAGARNFNWIKFKRSYKGQLEDTLDCVVVGYWWGKGMRTQFGIGSLLTAVYDKDIDKFYTIARLGTGLSELEWVQMKGLLDAAAVADKPARLEAIVKPDVWVEPKYVIEIRADEITRSPMHTAGRQEGGLGYALRFPRMVNFVREDRLPEDATTVKEILEMYEEQGKRLVSAAESKDEVEGGE